MKKYIILLTSVLLLSWNCSAFAQIALGKYRERVDIAPGQTVKGEVTLNNRSDKLIFLKAYLKDIKFVQPFDGKKEILPAGSTLYSISKWIKLSPESFNIPAGGKQIVTYTVNVPEGVKGSYYGTIYFEKSASGKVEINTSVSLSVSWGYTLFLETNDKIKQATIEGVSFVKDAIQGNIANTGNVLLVSSPTFYVMDEKDIVLDRGKLQDFYLPSGEKTTFKAQISKKIPQGKHTLILNFDFGGVAPLVKEIYFSKTESGEIQISETK
ncbi:MAG: hypothetical protein NTY14_02080 [Candidatus Omnitrophica bacterium]|nr:hypothetical protein [Candidatus Omnitrophota bacterium]